jgi:hypothetical protein
LPNHRDALPTVIEFPGNYTRKIDKLPIFVTMSPGARLQIINIITVVVVVAAGDEIDN